MMCHRRFALYLGGFVASLIVCVVALNWFIDPYSVFRTTSSRASTTNDRALKIQWMLNHVPYDYWLIGSSTAGVCDATQAANVRGYQTGYNLSFLSATPEEWEQAVQTLVRRGQIPKHVTILLDVASFGRDDLDFNSPSKWMPPEVSGESFVHWSYRYLVRVSPRAWLTKITNLLSVPAKYDVNPATGSYHAEAISDLTQRKDPTRQIDKIGRRRSALIAFESLIRTLRDKGARVEVIVPPVNPLFREHQEMALVQTTKTFIEEISGGELIWRYEQSLVENAFYDHIHFRPDHCAQVLQPTQTQ